MMPVLKSLCLLSLQTGNTFFRWGGTENNFSNPNVLTMNSHKTVVGIMMDTTGLASFPVETSPRGFASMNSLGYSNGTTGGSGPEAGVVFVTTSTQFVDLMYSRVDANHTSKSASTHCLYSWNYCKRCGCQLI